MASVTTYMGLTKWDSTADYFSHTQLAANFQAIDDHDHTSGKGKQIPAGALANGAVAATNIVDGAVATAKLADAAVTNVKLASPLGGAHRTLVTGRGTKNSTNGSGTYFLHGGVPSPSGSTTVGAAPVGYHIIAADYTVASMTTKLRIRATCTVNTVAPSTGYTFGLYAITSVTGTSGNLVYTMGGVVSGSQPPAFTTSDLAASSTTVKDSGDFSLPSDGLYLLGFSQSGGQAAGSVVGMHVALQLRHV